MNASLLYLILFSVVVAQTPLCPDGSSNHNITTAQPLEVSSGTNVSSTICSLGLRHYYSLKTSNITNAFAIWTTVYFDPNYGSIGATLTNSNGTRSTFTSMNFANGIYLMATLSDKRCPDGNCILQLDLDNPAPNIAYNNYTISTRSWPCVEDQNEPNDSPNMAAPAVQGRISGTNTLCAMDVDYFKLVTKAEQILSINYTSNGFKGALVLQLFNSSNMNLLAVSNASRLDFKIPAGSYIFSFSTPSFVEGWGVYVFTVSPPGGWAGVNITTNDTYITVPGTNTDTTSGTSTNITTTTPEQTIEFPSNLPVIIPRQNEDNSIQPKLIAIIVASTVSGVLFLCSIGALSCFIHKRRKSQTKHTFREKSGGIRDSLGSDSELERTFSKRGLDSIPFSELAIEGKIGEGSTGMVYRAKWRETIVAIKQLHHTLNDRQALMDFRTEARLMRSLRPHPNVVLFIGVSVPPDPICIITEYLKQGSLSSYLETNGKTMDIKTKLKLMLGISQGILHLHREGIVHRDLAARNILLTSDLTPKVSDFGMSRQLEYEEKAHTCNRVGPLKWMAPESISAAEYSYKSDAWMFGIVCWEILTCDAPYSHLAPLQAATKVVTDNLRLDIPKGIPMKLNKLMKSCWRFNPKERPTFEKITNKLRKLLVSEKGQKESDEELLVTDRHLVRSYSVTPGLVHSQSQSQSVFHTSQEISEDPSDKEDIPIERMSSYNLSPQILSGNGNPSG